MQPAFTYVVMPNGIVTPHDENFARPRCDTGSLGAALAARPADVRVTRDDFLRMKEGQQPPPAPPRNHQTGPGIRRTIAPPSKRATPRSNHKIPAPCMMRFSRPSTHQWPGSIRPNHWHPRAYKRKSYAPLWGNRRTLADEP